MSGVNRASRPEGAEEQSFAQKLADFIRAKRGIFLGLLAAVIVIVAAVAVFSIVSNAQAEASTTRVEALADDIATWSAEADSAKKAELETKILAGLTEVNAKWPRSFAAARALSLRARLFEEKKDWAASEKDWAEIASRFPKTFLAPIALQNAAIAAEERGANEAAAGYYKRVVDGYAGKTVGVPHAWFSLGRLAEGSKDYTAAIAHYEKLVASFPDDDWTKLAKDRILFLKSRGLAK